MCFSQNYDDVISPESQSGIDTGLGDKDERLPAVFHFGNSVLHSGEWMWLLSIRQRLVWGSPNFFFQWPHTQQKKEGYFDSLHLIFT